MAPGVLSHHESHVLALVQKWQPTTAYFVRKALQRSLASSFSDSPGSVYPVIERLKKRGLVVAMLAGEDGRRTEHLTCSVEGEAEIAAWLSRIDPADLLPEDPWRTRVLFAELLTPAARTDLYRQLRAAAQGQLEELQARAGAVADDGFREALEGARLQTEGRIVWLDRLIAGTLTSNL